MTMNGDVFRPIFMDVRTTKRLKLPQWGKEEVCERANRKTPSGRQRLFVGGDDR